MATLLLTSHTNACKMIKPTFSLFSTTSGTFVAVTGASIAGVAIAPIFYLWWARTRALSSFNSEIRLIGSISGTIETKSHNQASMHKEPPTGTLRQLSALETFTLEVRWTGGSQTIEVEANGFATIEGRYTNVTDRFFKALVTDIKFMGFGAPIEGIEGGENKWSTDLDITTVEVDAIMSQFIFSLNDSLCLWDWTGSALGVSA